MDKVLGIGNALVDTILPLESDDLLEELHLPKGSMQLVDQDHMKRIEKRCEGLDTFISSGGCAANTIHGLARLGVIAGYIGKVGKDELGRFFVEDLRNSNISPQVLEGKSATGHALAFISPDSERTFATYLGAALELDAGDLEHSFFKGYQYLHVEGYLLQNHRLLEEVFRMAKENGLKISLDLASFNVVEENMDVLKKWINEYVDILFANEEEAKSYTGKEPEEAVHQLAEQCEIAIVKVGKDGSIIKRGDELCRVNPIKVDVVDTTGAGDAYAAGFLYGLVKGLSIEKSGDIAALLAGKVIEDTGAKLREKQWEAILEKVT